MGSTTRDADAGGLVSRLPGPGVLRLLALCLLLGVTVGACANGTYPLDFFYEMHYQQSYQSHEPPRLSPPEGAVPITGKAVFGAENPIEGQKVDEGKRLFASNCAFCHGETGRGDGEVLNILRDKYGYEAVLNPDLTSSAGPSDAQSLPDAAVFGWITAGVNVMPSFDKLLTVEERWMLVNYIRTLP